MRLENELPMRRQQFIKKDGELSLKNILLNHTVYLGLDGYEAELWIQFFQRVESGFNPYQDHRIWIQNPSEICSQKTLFHNIWTTSDTFRFFSNYDKLTFRLLFQYLFVYRKSFSAPRLIHFPGTRVLSKSLKQD